MTDWYYFEEGRSGLTGIYRTGEMIDATVYEADIIWIGESDFVTRGTTTWLAPEESMGRGINFPYATRLATKEEVTHFKRLYIFANLEGKSLEQ